MTSREIEPMITDSGKDKFIYAYDREDGQFIIKKAFIALGMHSNLFLSRNDEPFYISKDKSGVPSVHVLNIDSYEDDKIMSHLASAYCENFTIPKDSPFMRQLNRGDR